MRRNFFIRFAVIFPTLICKVFKRSRYSIFFAVYSKLKTKNSFIFSS